MLIRSRALALRGAACGAACVAAALAVAGCSQTGSGSSSSSGVTVSGKTLHIYMSEPSRAQLAADPAAQDVIDAEKLAFLGQYSEVKDFKLVLVPDQNGKVSDNAREAIQDSEAIAYLGELAPGSSDQTVGITNALDLLEVSPTDTALELSQSTPAVSAAPQSYFESWSTYGETFARMVPSSAQEARAQVAEMKALGVSSLYVAHDGSDYGRALALALSADARGAGISISTTMRGAGAIFYGGDSPAVAASFFKRAATAAPSAKLFGPSALNSGAFTAAAGSGLRNLYVTIPGVLPRQLNTAGKSFDADFRNAYHHQPNVEAIFGYEAMSALLTVLERAGHAANDRATVVRDFLKLSQSQSVLGSYRINSAGDTSLDAFVIARLRGGRLVPFKAAPSL